MRTAISDYLNLAQGVRLSIGVLAGALGSATLIGLVSEYAAVSYAMAHGARVPAEGLSYLRYATAGVSFALFTLALGSFFGLYALLRLLLRFALNHTRVGEIQEIDALPLKKYLIVFIPGAFLATQPLYGSLFILATKNVISEYAPGIVVAVVAALLLVFGRKPRWISWFTLGIYVVGTIIIVVALFSPSVYEKMLRSMRFGGGMPIEITRSCGEVVGCESVVRGSLFLRTAEFFLIYDSVNERITEIPASNVIQYSYEGENRWSDCSP